MNNKNGDVPVIIVSQWEGSKVETLKQSPAISNLIITPPSVPVGPRSALASPSSEKKNKKISFSAARVHVVECVDENNNPPFEPNCWFKFLSIICFWRVSCLPYQDSLCLWRRTGLVRGCCDYVFNIILFIYFINK